MDKLQELLNSKDPTYKSVDEKITHRSLIWQLLNECEYPFRWGLDTYREKPFTIIEDRFCHYTWEHFLTPFLWRITWAYEASRKDEVITCVTHLELARNLLEKDSEMNSKRSRTIGKSMQHILLATVAHLFAKQYQFTNALACLKELKILGLMTPKERAGIFGMKAVILSKYGEDGKIQALESIVGALKIVPEDFEWRFVCIELICALYEKNLGPSVVKAVTSHMHYRIQDKMPDGEKVNVNSFSHYFRNTWTQRDLAGAANILEHAVACANKALQDPTIVSAAWLEALHKDVLTAIETDPHSRILIPATKFYMLFDVHKALSVSAIGRKSFRFCAESWVEMWSLLYPLEEFNMEEILRYYTLEWSIPILKKASICFVNQQPKRAFTIALKVLQDQYKEWIYMANLGRQVPREPPMTLWKNEIPEGFYSAMFCLALTMRNNPAAKSYIDFYRKVFKLQTSNGKMQVASHELYQSLKEIFSENKYFTLSFSGDLYVNVPKELIHVK